MGAVNMRTLTVAAIAIGALAALTTGVVLSVPDTVDLLRAMSTFAWPVLVLVLLLRLWPTIGDVVRSRKLEVEFGGVRVSVLDLLEQLPRQLDDLRLHSDGSGASQVEALPTHPQASPRDDSSAPSRILWVDDRLDANVYEKQTLLDDGWQIESATSTREAVTMTGDRWSHYAVVISDMGRLEDGQSIPDAGIQLVTLIRDAGSAVPFFIYTNRRGRERRSDAIQAGADGLTTSPTELLNLVRRAINR
jgi:CheY-like chemotaxis protein